ncbi:hypothetical protein INT45_001875 [Circinella minor]|uniref:Uncharacterized protein n=1 Tax=Circinella minor TaxID=1195481 RepID=A0A8H7S1I3_9FUNG|nr:hypothetical protein INT45_001875 [Circinella minor]
MTETGQMQRTLAIARGGKDELINLLKDAEISIILEKSISLSVADAKELTAKNTNLRTSLGSKPAHGYVLEADDVVQRWLDIMRQHDEIGEKAKKRYLYGSPSRTVAEQDIVWLSRLTLKQKKLTTGLGSKLPTPSTATRKMSSASTMKKGTTAAETRRATGPQQTRLTQRPKSAASNRFKPQPKQTSNTTIKETSKVTISQRSQRDSTIPKTQRQKAAMTTRHPVVQRVKNNDGDDNDVLAIPPVVNNNDSSNISGNSSSVSTAGFSEEQEASRTAMHHSNKKVNQDAASSDVQSDILQDVETITPYPPLGPGNSQTSKVGSDKVQEVVEDAESEHDAEVAAAMNHTSNIPTTAMDQSVLRASLSPNSVTSLPRPETPEVDQLRQRFESFGQVGATNSGNQFQHRKSLSPETALKIKDTRPKTPSGKRVKSMVNFFMDENLHKWEF